MARSRWWGRSFVTAALLAAALALAAVAGAATGSKNSAKVAKDQFVWMLPVLPQSIDPAAYEGRQSSDIGPVWSAPLLRWKTIPTDAKALQGPYGMEPFLADTYKKLPTGSWQFHLRDAKSPAGNTVTSADVKWTFDRIIANDAVARSLMAVGNMDKVAPIEIVDDKTFNLHITGATALAISPLRWYSMGILDSVEIKKHVTDSDPWGKSWLKTNTATFGPYKVDAFQPGTSIVFSANPNFWAKPYFTKGVIRAIPDAGSRLQIMKSGGATHTNYLDYSQMADAAKDPKLEVFGGVSANQDSLVLNNRIKPFNDARVRQAISMAIDRAAIVKSIYYGYGIPSTGEFAPAVPLSAASTYFKYDQAAAKKLLADAGYPTGLEFTATTNVGNPGNHVNDLAVLVQSQLAKIGVKMNIQPIASLTEHEAGQRAGKYEAALRGWRPGINDGAYTLFIFFYSKGLNTYPSGYVNADVDKATLASITLEPGKRRDRAVNAAQKVINTEVPWTPLVQTVAQHVFAGGVKGYSPYPFDEMWIDRLSR